MGLILSQGHYTIHLAFFIVIQYYVNLIDKDSFYCYKQVSDPLATYNMSDPDVSSKIVPTLEYDGYRLELLEDEFYANPVINKCVCCA